ncbi:MAG TPA: tetratricopeptide repeat protein [Polyangiaceae bacterium]|nr:tetratricopeptide repeat protein [Polyangiaceae bacterium]
MPRELERIFGDVQWAKANSFSARELVPMLQRLVKAAPEGSHERRYGRRELAPLIVAKDPWLAARLARDVLQDGPDDRAWGVLGLAHTMLGHYRSAARAYRTALELAPGTPEYEHNLGHLLDVAFNRPLSAVPHLRRARAALPDEPEIGSSLAHALLRVGRVQEAERLLLSVFDGNETRMRATVTAWLAGTQR